MTGQELARKPGTKRTTLRERFTVAGLGAVAQFFDVGLDTVNRWRQVGMPGARGEWDLGAIARWRMARQRSLRRRRRLDPEYRLLDARAGLLQLKLTRLRASLMSTKEHYRYLAAAMSCIRETTLRHIEPLAEELEGLDLTERVHHIRQCMIKILSNLSDDDDPPATCGADDQGEES